nr:hypothetical protein [Tanacetum cinerariifolium]
MEEMLYSFDEGRCEHEEMGEFIKEFQTTNELLLKERNNSLSELEFEVYELSKAINNAQTSNYKVKCVNTRGGKTMTEISRDTNNVNKEPPILHHDKPVEPNKVLVKAKTHETKVQTILPSTQSIPFPHRLKKEREEAQQWKFLENLKQLYINILFTKALSQMPKYAKFLKGLLSNKTKLEEACTVTMNERCLEKLGLGDPKPIRISLELADRSIQYTRGIAENFSYPSRRLTMEEMLYSFDEGRCEHEEMGEFIKEFQTTNELLLKERNNSLSELEFEVYELSKAINNAQTSNYKVKCVNTRGGKTMTEISRDTNNVNKEPPILHHDKPVEPNKVLVKAKTHETKVQTILPSTQSIPFPHRLKKEREEAQQWKFLENLKQLYINILFTKALSQMPKYAKFLKGLLSNKTKLEEACTVTMNERCLEVLLNKLPSKEKDLGSFTIPCDIGHLHINNALAYLGASISLIPYTMC